MIARLYALVARGRSRRISATISIITTVVTLGYFLPWMIAALRGKSNGWPIFWRNLLPGWTLVGWLAALVLAVMAHQVAGSRREGADVAAGPDVSSARPPSVPG